MKLQTVGISWLAIGLAMQISTTLAIACGVACVVIVAILSAPEAARELREIWNPPEERERRRLEHEHDCKIWGVTPPESPSRTSPASSVRAKW